MDILTKYRKSVKMSFMNNPAVRYQNQIPSKGPASLGLRDTVSVLKEVLFGKGRKPSSRLPEVKPHLPEFLAPSDALKFIWFGHSTLLLNLNNHVILVDPVFHHASPMSFMVKRFQEPVLGLHELPAIDTILISHDHYDHLDGLTIDYFKAHDIAFIVPRGVGKHLRSWGVSSSKITELSWHESVSYKGTKFTAAPAQHFSGRSLFDRNQTLWVSWILEGISEKIYYSGDSGYGPHFRDIGDQYGPFHYAFLENGQYNFRWPDVHMHPEETLQAHLDLNAEIFIPVHWGMFDLSLHHWTEPVERTHQISRSWEIPMLTPRLGEIIDMNHPSSTPWWTPYLPAKADQAGAVLPGLAAK